MKHSELIDSRVNITLLMDGRVTTCQEVLSLLINLNDGKVKPFSVTYVNGDNEVDILFDVKFHDDIEELFMKITRSTYDDEDDDAPVDTKFQSFVYALQEDMSEVTIH